MHSFLLQALFSESALLQLTEKAGGLIHEKKFNYLDYQLAAYQLSVFPFGKLMLGWIPEVKSYA